MSLECGVLRVAGRDCEGPCVCVHAVVVHEGLTSGDADLGQHTWIDSQSRTGEFSEVLEPQSCVSLFALAKLE